MKYMWIRLLIVGLIIGVVSPAKAVTVYLNDGTQLEVDKVTRIGDTVCLFLDVSRIDITRTKIEDMLIEKKITQGGLVVANADFSPSEDNTEIIAAGDIINNTQHAVQNVRVTAILMDKNDNVLLRIHGHVFPEVLSPGQKGAYRFQVKKPKEFWKASVEVQADAVQ